MSSSSASQNVAAAAPALAGLSKPTGELLLPDGGQTSELLCQHSVAATGQEAAPSCVETPPDRSREELAIDFIKKWRSLAGRNTVLLPVPWGEKGCRMPGWQKCTVESTRNTNHLGQVVRGNIGVLMGSASRGLCCLDIDRDDQVEPFFKQNPRLRETLRVRGARGVKIFVRVIGEFPKLSKIKGFGDWLADGAQSVVYGQHPSGCHYRLEQENAVAEMPFSEIAWPDSVSLPWAPKPKSAEESSLTGGGDVPFIILPGGEVSINQGARRLFGLIGPTKTLFSRGGVVVELAEKKGNLVLEVLRPERARSMFEKYGKLVAVRSGANSEPVLKGVVCPEETASALLETDAARQMLPKINGLLNCPIAVESEEGMKIVGQGYDPESGLLITGGKLPPDVALNEAVEALETLLGEFDFQTPGDRSRAISSFITPALRLGGHITGRVPVDVAEADRSQSGKTFRQRVVAALYNEKTSLVTLKQGGVGSTDEAFDGQLVNGRPFIQFDNFRGHLNSKHLEAFLTAEHSFPARVPHSRQVEVDPSRFFIQLSSNGVETTPDLANRSCIIRIRKRQGFSFKPFPEGDLLAHVRANQPYYLGCVFAIILEWLAQGKPRTAETRHDFRDWCQVADWIIQNVFRAAPLMEGHGSAQERVSNAALTFIRKLALAIEKKEQLGEEFIAGQLFEMAEEEDIDIPGLKTRHENSARQIIGRIMSKLFDQRSFIEVDGFLVTRHERTMSRDDTGSGSYTTKCYVFRWSEPPALEPVSATVATVQ